MKKLLTILFTVALGLNLSAQDECSNPQDANQDGVIGVDDLMDLLSHWGDTDFDFDGVYDSVDLCTDEGALIMRLIRLGFTGPKAATQLHA